MGNNRKKWLYICNGLLTAVMTFLGFSGCERYGPDEYGSPYTTYKVKGKVVNSKEQQIPDIQIIIKDIAHVRPEYSFLWDTLYTDNKGEFLFETSDGRKDQLRIDYQDVKNDVYKPDSTDIKMPAPTGGKGWYQGVSEREITIILKEKTNEDNAE